MTTQLTRLTDEENAKLIKYMDEVGSDTKWSMVFNELCEDGTVRPVLIHPKKVTSVKKQETPVAGSKYGAADLTFADGTIIVHDGREILLFESLPIVLPALGAAMATSDYWAAHLFYARAHFEERNVNYVPPGFPDTSQSNDTHESRP